MFITLESRLSRYSEFAPTVLRIALGVVFLAHAYAKAFLFTFPGTADFFIAHGFPGWTAYPVFVAELVCGLALLAGFFVRTSALVLVPVMLGALVPHVDKGFMFTNPGGGWEYVAFLLAALVAQALLGSGAFALDRALGERTGRGARSPSAFGMASLSND